REYERRRRVGRTRLGPRADADVGERRLHDRIDVAASGEPPGADVVLDEIYPWPFAAELCGGSSHAARNAGMVRICGRLECEQDRQLRGCERDESLPHARIIAPSSRWAARP